MKDKTVHFPPKRVTDIVELKKWGSKVTCNLSFEVLPVDFAHIDNQVDFAVSLRRYAELSGEMGYKEIAKDLAETILDKYYTSEGYLTFVGNVKSNPISPKYNALLLKNMILSNKPVTLTAAS